eukprot:3674806-Pleurochrysis_carterae.AAC.1
MRGERAIETIVYVIKRVKGSQRVFLKSSVEVRLHHGLDGHAGGRRGIVSGTADDADKLPAARVTAVALVAWNASRRSPPFSGCFP